MRSALDEFPRHFLYEANVDFAKIIIGPFLQSIEVLGRAEDLEDGSSAVDPPAGELIGFYRGLLGFTKCYGIPNHEPRGHVVLIHQSID